MYQFRDGRGPGLERAGVDRRADHQLAAADGHRDGHDHAHDHAHVSAAGAHDPVQLIDEIRVRAGYHK